MLDKSTESIRKTPGLRKPKSQLSEIFKSEDGKRVDMTRFERKKRNPRKVVYIVLSIALVLLGVATAGFFLFVAQDKEYRGQSVQLEAQTPDRVAAGEDFPITFTVRNVEDVPLQDFVMAIQFPEGYTVKTANRSANNEAKNAFTLGTLSPNEESSVTITGNLIGAVGEEKTFGLTFTFQPQNFNYQFNETASASVRISTSALTMDLEGPQEIAPGSEATWTVKVTNTSSDVLTALRLTLETPDDFTITSSDPQLSDGQRWSIDTLAPDEAKEVHFSGSFAQSEQEFVELGITSSINRNGVEDVQGHASVLILLVKPELFLTLEREDDHADKPIKPGDRIPVKLSYENTSELALADVTLTMTLDADSPLVASNLSAVPEASVDGLTFTWNKEKLPDLAQVKPGTKGDVTLSFTIPQPLVPESEDDFEQNVIVSAHSNVGSVSDLDNPSFAGAERTLTMPVATVLSVSGEARYYSEEGIPIGEGPLPPEAGKSTTYVIQWFVTNSTNNVDGFSVVATIPRDVFWPGTDVSATAGTIAFDPVTREVRWEVNTIPAGTGMLSPTLSATFTVRITPNVNQVGSTPVLVDAATITGTDTHTSTPITSSIETMTTDLLHDTRGSGQGEVILGSE